MYDIILVSYWLPYIAPSVGILTLLYSKDLESREIFYFSPQNMHVSSYLNGTLVNQIILLFADN